MVRTNRIRPTPLFRIGTTPSLYGVMDELGLVHDIRARLYGPPTPITVALPDRRFDFPATPEERAVILSETFPDSTDALLTLFGMVEEIAPQLDGVLDGPTQCPLDGAKAVKNMEKFLGNGPCRGLMGHNPEWSSDPDVRTLVYAMLATLYEVTQSQIGRHRRHFGPCGISVTAFRAFAMVRSVFSNLIAQKLLSTGGTIEERRVVSHLDIRRSTVKTVVTADGGRFTADAVVLDGGDASLSALWDDFEAPQPSVCEMKVLLPPEHCGGPQRSMWLGNGYG